MLGFPEADRSQIDRFTSNYLKTVIFQVRYNNNKKAVEKKEEYVSLFKEIFPRVSEKKESGFQISMSKDQTPILQPIPSTANGMELRSEDGQKVLTVLDDGLTFTINGSIYKNFSHVRTDLDMLIRVLGILEIESVNRVAIRKINILDYEIPPDMTEMNPVSVMQLLLNPGLVSNLNYFPNQEKVSKSIHNVVYKNDQTTLNLRYGVTQTNTLEKKGQIIVDIDLFEAKDLTINNIIDKFNSINVEIFNIFNWSMKADTLQELMKNTE